jgi:hypothetical protein
MGAHMAERPPRRSTLAALAKAASGWSKSVWVSTETTALKELSANGRALGRRRPAKRWVDRPVVGEAELVA